MTEDLKVGLLFSLSGALAATEKGQYKAALLAIDEINKHGGVLGKTLTPMFKDTCSDPDVTAKVTEKLLEEDIQLLIGLSTSAGRKSILPLLAKHDCLLFHPAHYEGAEQHPNVIYCGPLPNQLLFHYIPWLMKHIGKSFYLIGSDYHYPKEMNNVARRLISQNGGEIAGASYHALGEKQFEQTIKTISTRKPDVVFSTLVGESAQSFYECCHHLNFPFPIADTIISETDNQLIDPRYIAGHYFCSSYFSSLNQEANVAFKRRFQAAYGTEMISAAMEHAYNSVHIMAEAIQKASSLEIGKIKKHIAGLVCQAPQGKIIVDQKNQHLWLHSHIGQFQKDGSGKILSESAGPVKPSPFPLKGTPEAYRNENVEASLSAHKPVITELKKAASFFPYYVTYFDQQGRLLDLFQPEMKEQFPDDPLDPGVSIWATDFLKHTGMSKAILKKELSFSLGSDHQTLSLNDWITVGIPIFSENELFGALGVFVRDNQEFELELFISLVKALKVVAENSVSLFQQSKESKFLYELLHDVTNDLEEALLVKKQEKIIYTNGLAEQLISEKDKLMLSLYQENFDHISYKRKQLYKDQSNSIYEVYIVPAHDYRYLYIKKLSANKKKQKKSREQPLLLPHIAGSHPKLLEAISLAKTASTNSTNVLLLGESGTGKEIFARAIHNESTRKDKPFVTLHCATLNEPFIASKLFGYRDGPFSGGIPGKFEQANGGTLFLDEIGEMPAELQAIILRVLRQKEISRLGGQQTIPLDVRIIAATNKDLSQEIAYKGTLSSDLYYRLNVFPIELIPLRERKEDIAELVALFLEEFAERDDQESKTVSSEALHYFMNYSWPGNIRELRNVVELAYELSGTDRELHLEHLSRALSIEHKPPEKYEWTKVKHLEEIRQVNRLKEREDIMEALVRFKGNISKSSKHLGFSRTTLYKKMKEYKLDS
ncbi:transporter substrate-binding protein [Halalkalibacter oceani]|uniref:transporter substrate-binding protein n=1 Tax=Halalkalibacter oceani TaxID=1653776 RepID=UPI0033931F03